MADEFAASEPDRGDGPRLETNREHVHGCHERWIERMTRRAEGSAYLDHWYQTQCGGCRFYIRLTGAFKFDWGVCSNPASPRDGLATFEHDGCDAFSLADGGWE